MTQTDLAVIIVTWNVRELALQAVRSLLADLATTTLRARVIVVDNASSDGTPAALEAAFPQIDVMALQENLGFAGGNNAALRELGFDGDTPVDQLPQAVYLLNPDTITKIGATEALYAALMANLEVGIVGANLTYGDGSFQHGAFAFPGLRQIIAEFFPLPGRLIEGRFNGRYPRSLYAGQAAFRVDFTLGATMMIRREAVEATGGFDTDFFMYCEEIDWAWRIHRAGWYALCVPTAHVIHLGGQSTGQVSGRSVINLWESRLKLYQKHYPYWKLMIARWLVDWGMRRKLRQLAGRSDLSEPQQLALRQAYETVRQVLKA